MLHHWFYLPCHTNDYSALVADCVEASASILILIVVFTICRIIILMCTILLVPHSRRSFWNMTGSYLSDGNLSKQFSALIVSCDIICSYLCSFYDEVYDFWHMTWKMTKCSLCFMCCNVTSLSWQMFDVPRLICLFNCLKFILVYLSHLE